MNSTPPNPTFPSFEHEWALLRLSTKKAWVGLTSRELVIITSLIAENEWSDWLLWKNSWTEWKFLNELEIEFNIEPIKLSEDIQIPK